MMMKNAPWFGLALAGLLGLSIFNAVAQAPSPAMRKADSLFFAQDWAAAHKVYVALLGDTSHNAIAWNRLGFSAYHLGNITDALKYYNRSLANKPSVGLKASVYSRMARVNALQNKADAAFGNIDSAITSGYINYTELDSLKDFALIRNTERFKQLRQRAYLAANPCMTDTHSRQFDFWAGEWNVYEVGTSTLVGHSLVQVVSGGCALLENWQSTGGASNGKSLNFVDDITHKWRQTWVGSYVNGKQDFVNGEYLEGAMRFTFITTDAQGHKLIGRFIFFNEGPNQVRQFNETSADDGKTWTTAYNYTYIRVKKA